MGKFEEQIKLLIELQGLDSNIFRIEKTLESIPLDIKELEEDFSGKTKHLKEVEDKVKSLQVKRKEKEIDLQSKEESIKKLKVQLYQVKTNKEYSALQQEIERAKADNSVLEEDIIKLFDDVDQENSNVEKEKQALKVQEGKLNSEKNKRMEEAKGLEGELAKLRDQRKALTEKVDGTLLPKYEKLLKHKDGLAMVPVRGEACQGCFRVMPPQVINEIKMKKDLIVCESCSRILYIEE